MSECICEGNWRAIVAESLPLLDKKFLDSDGKEYTFYGVVWGSDDFYYGMYRQGECRLISCVVSLEFAGFKPKDKPCMQNS